MKHILLASAILFSLGCATTEEPATDALPESTSAEMVKLSSFDPQVDELLAQMTLAEKVGQMTQADMSYLEAESDIATYFLGSVLNGGGSDPTPENTLTDWRDMAERYQAQAASTRLGIPLIHGVDAVHGHSNVVGAVIYPHNIGLGATGDAELVEKVYRATALETLATGIHWAFSPCAAVAEDIRWGRTYEAFGQDPTLVADLSEAAVRGLQGSGLGDPRGVVGCTKHYVGDGGTTFGTGAPKEGVPESVFAESGGPEGDTSAIRWPLDRGNTEMDEETLRRVHMTGYVSTVKAGVGTIMPSFSSWNGTKLSEHKYLLTDVLKGEMGFEGFLISDWAALDEIPGEYETDVERSINAGMDMVMVPDKYQEFIATLTRLVEEGRVPMERIDDAVRRILRVKFAAGLFEGDRAGKADRSLAALVGSDEHRALGREAVQRSLVVLRNENATLPLATDLARIHVTGKNADDLGNQCGGWTIQWQGASGEITEGTTVLEAVRAAVGEGTEVTYSADGSGAEGADVVIAVIGETPYSEMMGDTADLSLDEADTETVRRAAATGAPVVAVLISGRPMVLGETLESSSAFVAAWLPGTEGEGIADVLFGQAAPSGKLAFAWPASNDDLPLGPGSPAEAALFPLGYGLSY